MNPGERLVVGQVRGLHGLRGAVRVESLTDRETERFVAGRQLYVEGATTPLTIVAADQDGPGWRMRFAEVVDRTAAEALRDAYLEVILGPGDVFWTGVGCIHAFYNRSPDRRVRWLETQAPQPPANHSYRFNRDWDYLAERL